MTDRELLKLIFKNQVEMQSDIKTLDRKVDAVYEHVAKNTEQLDRLEKSMEFMKARQFDVEEQLFHLKKKIS